MIALTQEPIRTDVLLQRMQSPRAGAVVLFLGVTREYTGGQQTRRLTYQCYEAMAVKELEKLEEQARRRWPLEDCCLIHRLGEVPLGEASVAIAVSSPHRTAAFDAGRWLIDTLKQVVPIWKQEHWADGSTEWVHPCGSAGDLPQADLDPP